MLKAFKVPSVIIVALLLLTVSVACNKEFNLNVYLGGGQGAVTPSSGTYTEGTLIALTAIPDSGWEFSHWEGSISGSENPCYVRMNSDKTIGVYFVGGPTPAPTATPMTTPTPTPAVDNISMLTPYVNSSDMDSINEAFSCNASAPWGFQHTAIDFFPAGNYKPFQAVASGTVENISLLQNPGNSNWQVNVRVRVNPTYTVSYAFEPFSSNQADGNTQLANIFVSEGQNVAQGDIIGNLLEVDTGAAHVDWQLQQNWISICPESYFTASARESILDLIHKNNPTWNMCYCGGTPTPTPTPTDAEMNTPTPTPTPTPLPTSTPAPTPTPTTTSSDLELLQGTWTGYYIDSSNQLTYTFSGNTYTCTMTGAHNEHASGTFVLNPSANPKNIDVFSIENSIANYIGRTQLGVYSLNSNSLTLQISDPDWPRATSLTETVGEAAPFTLIKQ